MRELNPTPKLLYNYKNGIIDKFEYEKIYRTEVLAMLNPFEIAEKTKGKVLCCWEKSGDFCHRILVLNWIQEALGEYIIGGEI